ncbi:hypothetical protein V8E36_006611, partial [Tilletia maclaganii]
WLHLPPASQIFRRNKPPPFVRPLPSCQVYKERERERESPSPRTRSRAPSFPSHRSPILLLSLISCKTASKQQQHQCVAPATSTCSAATATRRSPTGSGTTAASTTTSTPTPAPKASSGMPTTTAHNDPAWPSATPARTARTQRTTQTSPPPHTQSPSKQVETTTHSRFRCTPAFSFCLPFSPALGDSGAPRPRILPLSHCRSSPLVLSWASAPDRSTSRLPQTGLSGATIHPRPTFLSWTG